MAEEPILCFDGDKAGLKAAYRAIDTALPLIGAGKTLRFVLLPGGQDPDELLRSGGARALAEVLEAPLPLVEVLWRRETEERALDTPERRATLERRLSEITSLIADPTLRRYYGLELSERLSRLLGGAGTAGPGSAWAPRKNYERANRGGREFRPATASRAGARRRVIGQFALVQGSQISGFGARVPNSLILSTIRRSLRTISRILPLLSSSRMRPVRSAICWSRPLPKLWKRRAQIDRDLAAGLSETISKAGLASFLGRLKGMAAHANLWSVQPEAATADAAITLRQVLSLHRKVWALNRELRNIAGRLAEDPSEGDAARLADIQTQLSTLEGTEAALEGFGAMSGRASRGL